MLLLPSPPAPSPRGGGPRRAPSTFLLYRACPPTWRKIFHSFHFSLHWTPGGEFIILSEHVCDLVLYSGERYFSGTINCSEYSLYFENLVSNLYIYIYVFCILVRLMWQSIVCSSSLFVNFGSPVFLGHLNAPCSLKVTKAEGNVFWNPCDYL